MEQEVQHVTELSVYSNKISSKIIGILVDELDTSHLDASLNLIPVISRKQPSNTTPSMLTITCKCHIYVTPVVAQQLTNLTNEQQQSVTDKHLVERSVLENRVICWVRDEFANHSVSFLSLDEMTVQFVVHGTENPGTIFTNYSSVMDKVKYRTAGSEFTYCEELVQRMKLKQKQRRDIYMLLHLHLLLYYCQKKLTDKYEQYREGLKQQTSRSSLSSKEKQLVTVLHFLNGTKSPTDADNWHRIVKSLLRTEPDNYATFISDFIRGFAPFPERNTRTTIDGFRVLQCTVSMPNSCALVKQLVERFHLSDYMLQLSEFKVSLQTLARITQNRETESYFERRGVPVSSFLQSLCNLCADSYCEIFLFFSTSDMLAFTSTCTTLYALRSEQALWRRVSKLLCRQNRPEMFGFLTRISHIPLLWKIVGYSRLPKYFSIGSLSDQMVAELELGEYNELCRIGGIRRINDPWYLNEEAKTILLEIAKVKIVNVIEFLQRELGLGSVHLHNRGCLFLIFLEHGFYLESSIHSESWKTELELQSD